MREVPTQEIALAMGAAEAAASAHEVVIIIHDLPAPDDTTSEPDGGTTNLMDISDESDTGERVAVLV